MRQVTGQEKKAGSDNLKEGKNHAVAQQGASNVAQQHPCTAHSIFSSCRRRGRKTKQNKNEKENSKNAKFTANCEIGQFNQVFAVVEATAVTTTVLS